MTAAVEEMECSATGKEKWSRETESSSESSSDEGTEKDGVTCFFCHNIFSPGEVGRSGYRKHLVQEHGIHRNR